MKGGTVCDKKSSMRKIDFSYKILKEEQTFIEIEIPASEFNEDLHNILKHFEKTKEPNVYKIYRINQFNLFSMTYQKKYTKEFWDNSMSCNEAENFCLFEFAQFSNLDEIIKTLEGFVQTGEREKFNILKNFILWNRREPMKRYLISNADKRYLFLSTLDDLFSKEQKDDALRLPSTGDESVAEDYEDMEKYITESIDLYYDIYEKSQHQYQWTDITELNKAQITFDKINQSTILTNKEKNFYFNLLKIQQLKKRIKDEMKYLILRNLKGRCNNGELTNPEKFENLLKNITRFINQSIITEGEKEKMHDYFNRILKNLCSKSYD
jgi:hypothetical protein